MHAVPDSLQYWHTIHSHHTKQAHTADGHTYIRTYMQHNKHTIYLDLTAMHSTPLVEATTSLTQARDTHNTCVTSVGYTLCDQNWKFVMHFLMKLYRYGHCIHTRTQPGPLVKCSGSRVRLPTNMWVCSPGLSAKLNKGLGKVNGLLVVHCRGRAEGAALASATSNITITRIKQTRLAGNGSSGIHYKCSVKMAAHEKG